MGLMIITTTKKIIDEFTLGYIYSALWQLKSGYEKSDYDISDIYPFYLGNIIDDCKSFQKENAELLNEIYSETHQRNNKGALTKILPEHLGHDYWLYRNQLEPEFTMRIKKELAQKFEQAAIRRGKQELLIDNDTLKLILIAA
jgi:hypothetical protein